MGGDPAMPKGISPHRFFVTQEVDMSAKSLRVVAPGESAPAKSLPLTVEDAADHGSRRDLLVAMRARVATAVQDLKTPAPALAALTRRLMEIAKDIEALDAAGEEQDSGPIPDEAFDASAI